MIDGDKLIQRLLDNREKTKKKYPLMCDVGIEKWIYLQSHGYVSDRLTREGDAILFYKRGYPHIFGTMDWQGNIVWISDEEK